jgi:hypothetical protein
MHERQPEAAYNVSNCCGNGYKEMSKFKPAEDRTREDSATNPN